MLIQTPEGAGKVTLLINEVKIKIGSTVFFQAQAGGNMVITTVEGAASVETHGRLYTAYAGTQVTVPLNDDLSPAGPPSAPVGYDAEALQNLPLQVLDRQVTVAPPMSQTAIDQHVAQDDAVLSGNNGGQGGDNAGNNGVNCPDQSPGVSCDAPGQGDPCASQGQSCNAPGQGDPCASQGNSCNAPGQNNGNNGNNDGNNGNNDGNNGNGGNGGGNSGGNNGGSKK
jgi:hypothetical protein